MRSILNFDSSVESKNQPMFFGEELSIQRYDTYKYHYFEKNARLQISYFWVPEEITLMKDISEFKTLSEDEREIFTNNLKYQILLDSVQGRGPSQAFLPHCSLPELEGAINSWQFFEGIHSRSYTYIIKNLYTNPSEVFDNILDNRAIVDRAKTSAKYYNDFIETGGSDKTKLLLAMVNVFILESIRFYISFASTFSFAENRLLEGSAKIVSFIARDENLHMALTSYIIRKWLEDEPDMKKIFDENKEEIIIKMFDEAVEEEVQWAKYLFRNTSLIGLNGVLSEQYVRWLASNRLKKIGLSKSYGGPKKTPLPWMDNWLNSKSVQVAPQESELESYTIGGIKMDNLDLSGFSL